MNIFTEKFPEHGGAREVDNYLSSGVIYSYDHIKDPESLFDFFRWAGEAYGPQFSVASNVYLIVFISMWILPPSAQNWTSSLKFNNFLHFCKMCVYSLILCACLSVLGGMSNLFPPILSHNLYMVGVAFLPATLMWIIPFIITILFRLAFQTLFLYPLIERLGNFPPAKPLPKPNFFD